MHVRLIWGVEVHGSLKKQLEIDSYTSVSCVEKDPLASPSTIQVPKSFSNLFYFQNLFYFTKSLFCFQIRPNQNPPFTFLF